MQFLERLLSVIAPHQCLGCGAEPHLLCVTCGRNLPPATTRATQGVTSQVYAATKYEGIAKKLVQVMKFERAAAAAEDIAAVMAERFPWPGADYVVTHIPTANIRVRQRGYDQAELLARAFARRLGLVHTPLLARSGSARQLGKQRSVRHVQLQGAFRATHVTLLRHKRILLIDDVLTTGATFQSGSTVLLTAGAARVDGAVFAVTPLQ